MVLPVHYIRGLNTVIFLVRESFIVKTVVRLRMPSGPAMTCDEYGIDGLTWVLKELFVRLCKVTGSGSVKGT